MNIHDKEVWPAGMCALRSFIIIVLLMFIEVIVLITIASSNWQMFISIVSNKLFYSANIGTVGIIWLFSSDLIRMTGTFLPRYEEIDDYIFLAVVMAIWWSYFPALALIFTAIFIASWKIGLITFIVAMVVIKVMIKFNICSMYEYKEQVAFFWKFYFRPF